MFSAEYHSVSIKGRLIGFPLIVLGLSLRGHTLMPNPVWQSSFINQHLKGILHESLFKPLYILDPFLKLVCASAALQYIRINSISFYSFGFRFLNIALYIAKPQNSRLHTTHVSMVSHWAIVKQTCLQQGTSVLDHQQQQQQCACSRVEVGFGSQPNPSLGVNALSSPIGMRPCTHTCSFLWRWASCISD